MIAVTKPWTIIRSEDDEGILIKTVPLQGLQDLANRPINFHNDIAKQPCSALSFETFGNIQRDVDHRMRHVEEERLLGVSINKRNGSLCVPRCELCLLGLSDFARDNIIAIN